MTWPWPEGEAWLVSGTHTYGGPGRSKVWSSLDMLDGKGKCNWISNKNCTEDTPLLYAMFSGKIGKMVTKCKLSIVHSTGWTVDYYHMDKIIVKPLQHVRKGQPVGRYAGNYKTALCHGGGSVKPHLHIDLVNPSGSYKSLDGWKINEYKIHAGIRDYDTNCNRSYFEKNDIKYCPSGIGVIGDRIVHSSKRSL